jgi:hypothetical protein
MIDALMVFEITQEKLGRLLMVCASANIMLENCTEVSPEVDLLQGQLDHIHKVAVDIGVKMIGSGPYRTERDVYDALQREIAPLMVLMERFVAQ